MIARIAAVVVAALALAQPALAACAKPHTSLAAMEGEIMCPTCKTTLDQSDAPAARAIERRIQVLIDRCKTEQQIKDDLVRNFGAGILAAPPRKGFDLLAWWLPIGGVIAGALLVGFGVWRWSRSRGPDDEDGPPPGDDDLDPDTERRLDELLARFD
jgi:cytochrome c-type biogenesis protein CcmH/NrfF